MLTQCSGNLKYCCLLCLFLFKLEHCVLKNVQFVELWQQEAPSDVVASFGCASDM